MSNETEHPIGEAEHPVYRTSASRTGKMMIIMLGICLVGGIIFFAMWDYWISQPAPVVAMMAGEVDHAAPAAATGKTITQDLSFIESSDFRTLAFNALPGESDNNPTIQMNVGDTVVFNVDNAGVSFHAFGVTKADEGFAGIIPGSEIGAASSPLKPGEDGSSEFIAGEEGTYYYICTVPGHREQGMVGEIIIGPAQGSGSSGTAAAPTGVSHDFTLDFVESDDFRTLAFNALPGEDGHNPEIRVNSGDEVTVTVTNVGKSFHAFGVVSNPEDFNSIVMDSAIGSMSSALKSDESASTTFTAGAPGSYYYICTIPGHAIQGMQGSFIVE
jgi:nitrite reductase (NO-forming)